MKKIFILLIVITSAHIGFAQIPNGGFENWSTVGSYDSAWGWSSPNYLSSPINTCEKGTPGAPGTSYLKLTSKTVLGPIASPGIAVSGTFDATTLTPKSGFPYTGRPVGIAGNWQFMAFGSDTGHIVVYLSKWNTTAGHRDTVAFTDYTLPGMVMVWNSFSIPITYRHGMAPDSAIIILSASGTTPVNNSYLYVDSLNFYGSVPTSITTTDPVHATVSVYPNPAAHSANVLYNGIVGNIKVDICYLSGKIVRSQSFVSVAGDNKLPLDISGFAPGIYLVKVYDGMDVVTDKLTIE